MNLRQTFRTLVRVFLVLGGVAYLALGIQDGSALDVGIGVVALVLGVGGLYYQYYVQPRETGHPDEE